MTTRDELVVALAGRYALGSRADRGRMLDEFAALTGHHRKHAMRLLRAGVSSGSSPRPERRMYGHATREALIVVWEASDRICGKRLRPLVPILVSAMERHGHLQLAPEVLAGLLTMSAATMDRALRETRGATQGRPRRRSPPSAAIRRSVAVRTFSDWDDPAPGFMEADLVAHSGPTSKGSYVQTLTLTDIATGWTECAPVLVREQKLLTEVLSEMRKVLPFALLGFDTDNDSVFMNETVRDYCQAAGVEFTRSRPYRKNDQAWVEQKNGAVVRHTVGYRRYEGLEAAAALAMLYRSLRLYVNFFSAVVQAGREIARRRQSHEALSFAGHSAPAAERDPVWPAAAGGDRRSSCFRRDAGADCADAGRVPVRPTDGLARRRGAPDQPSQGEGKARPASSGPARRGDGAIT